jgi:anti-anti-sigma factor
MVETQFDELKQTLLCKFIGRMDTVMSGTVAEKVTAELSRLRDKMGQFKIVFDIKGVDYVASSFLRLCLITAKGLEKGNFSIVNTNPQVLKVFNIAGLSSILNVS